jgi:proline iminopeptidase
MVLRFSSHEEKRLATLLNTMPVHQIATTGMRPRFLVLLCMLHSSDRVESFSQTPGVVGQPKTPLTDSSSSLRTLYPPISPYSNGTLDVDSIHTIVYQEYGNPNGIPALFLHGGPGAGCFPRHAQFFDPALYRIVLLDQRGSGASTPRGEVQNNTLLHLVQDCETLRIKLGVNQWGVLLGGSWGSTLALAYAQEHTDKVQSLILRGVCLLRSMEVDWLFGGTSEFALQPAWRDFERAVGVGAEDGEDGALAKEGVASRRRQALHAHYDRLLSGDATLRLAAARSWMQWEMQVSASFKAPTNKTKGSKKSASTQQESETKEDANIVLVGRPKGDGTRAWGFRDSEGELTPTFISEPPSKFKEGLRKQMLQSPSSPPVVEQYEIRAIQPVANDTTLSSNAALTNASSGNTTSGNAASGNMTSTNATVPNQWANFIPSQAMLTCFFSVNDRYAMNNVNVLDRMDRIADIPCIAVQGGNDQICPVNTALDVAKAYPNMELRIPIQAGHSMYDPAITNELVRATDRLATSSTLAELK